MMKLIEAISRAAWCPKGLRIRLEEARLRPSVDALVKDVDALQAIARERLPNCVSRYSRNRIKYYRTEVPKQCSKLKESAGRNSLSVRGVKYFNAQFKVLETTLKTLQEVSRNDTA